MSMYPRSPKQPEVVVKIVVIWDAVDSEVLKETLRLNPNFRYLQHDFSDQIFVLSHQLRPYR